MPAIIEEIFAYLSANIAPTLFLCMGLGFLLGKVRIGTFTVGATVGTLIVGMVMSQLGSFDIPSVVKTLFFSLFCFTIGYEVGPTFFASLRSSGVKLVALAVFFVLCVFGTAMGVCSLFGFGKDTAIGVLAGAQTQTVIIEAGGASLGSPEVSVAYALAYVFGNVGLTVFVTSLAPKLMRCSLRDAVKARLDRQGYASSQESTHAAAIQLRAYRVEESSVCIGKTVDELEAIYGGELQIEKIYRGSAILRDVQDEPLQAGDVVAVIGQVDDVVHFDTLGMAESAEPKHLTVEISSEELVLTSDCPAGLPQRLSRGGILVQKALRRGKAVDANGALKKDDVLHLTGATHAIRQAAKKLGYLKDTGKTTDMPFLGFAIAAGLLLGTITIPVGTAKLALGTAGALISGLVCGWYYNRHPRFGRIPDSARWLMKNIGLNLFIAVVALSIKGRIMDVIFTSGPLVVLAGVLITMIPHLLAFLFARKVMRLDAVDTLGGLCGAGTCTPALNALSEETGSSVFAASYAPAYAVGDVLLTLTGMMIGVLL